MTIFDYCNYLYYAYVDDKKLFLEGYYFYKAYNWHFFFSHFSELKPNLRKSEIVGIAVLKGVHVAVFRMRCIDLNIDTLKISGTHFSYNKKSKENKFF